MNFSKTKIMGIVFGALGTVVCVAGLMGTFRGQGGSLSIDEIIKQVEEDLKLKGGIELTDKQKEELLAEAVAAAERQEKTASLSASEIQAIIDGAADAATAAATEEATKIAQEAVEDVKKNGKTTVVKQGLSISSEDIANQISAAVSAEVAKQIGTMDLSKVSSADLDSLRAELRKYVKDKISGVDNDYSLSYDDMNDIVAQLDVTKAVNDYLDKNGIAAGNGMTKTEVEKIVNNVITNSILDKDGKLSISEEEREKIAESVAQTVTSNISEMSGKVSELENNLKKAQDAIDALKESGASDDTIRAMQDAVDKMKKDLAGYATKEELEQAALDGKVDLTGYAKTADLDGYADKDYVDKTVSGVGDKVFDSSKLDSDLKAAADENKAGDKTTITDVMNVIYNMFHAEASYDKETNTVTFTKIGK